MIVELFGCPGAGKTYTLDALINEKNRNVDSGNIITETVKKIIKKMLLFSPCAIKVKKDISMVVFRDGGFIDSEKKKSIITQIKNIAMLTSVYKYSRKDLYIDEGIVHRVITLCVINDLPTKILEEVIGKFDLGTLRVRPFFLDTSVQVCFGSCVKRNRHTSYIDTFQGEALLEILTKYFHYSEFIADRFGFEHISREDMGEKIK